jgi:DNA adenine methylase
MTYWKQVKENKEIICNKLELITDIKKEDFNNYKKLLNNCNETEINKAIYYFIINRCSFSGSTLSGGFSKEASKKRFTKSSIDRIRNINLSNLELYNEDFNDFLNKFELFNDKTIIFLDPPYYLEDKSNRLYGTSGDLHKDFNHLKLFELIKTKKNWILTYNNSDYIKNLYKEFKIIDDIK